LVVWIALIFGPIILLIRAKSKILSSIGILLLFTFPLVTASPLGLAGQTISGPFLIPLNIIYLSILSPFIAVPSLTLGIIIGIFIWRHIRKKRPHRVSVAISAFTGVMFTWGSAEILQIFYMHQSARQQFGEQYCVASKGSVLAAVIGATPGAYFDPPAVWHAKLISPKGFYHWSYRELAWIDHHDDFLERNGVGSSAGAYQKCRNEQKK